MDSLKPRVKMKAIGKFYGKKEEKNNEYSKKISKEDKGVGKRLARIHNGHA